jgi:hypothetical protein
MHSVQEVERRYQSQVVTNAGFALPVGAAGAALGLSGARTEMTGLGRFLTVSRVGEEVGWCMTSRGVAGSASSLGGLMTAA